MKLRVPLVVSAVAVAALFTIGAWGWITIPDGARIATHWDIHGRPNGHMHKDVALLFAPCMAILLSALFAVLPAIEPRRRNLVASRKLYFAGWFGALAVLFVVQLLVVLTAAGIHVDMVRWPLVAVALLTAVLGNFLGKSRSAFLVGLRLPWTLTSELAWEKSNRLLGRGMALTGLVTLALVAFVGTSPALVVFAVGMVLSLVASIVTAYVNWKRDPDRNDADAVNE